MEQTKFLLTEEEHLWDVALRGIGIQLPEEYVIRFTILHELFEQKGLSNIHIDELASVENIARRELSERSKANTN